MKPSEEKHRPSGEQMFAIELCCDKDHRIVSVTGGAGTGKTYVLGKAYKALVKAGYTVALCAPTGRAAKRIKELTGISAKTVHKLLEFPQPSDDPLMRPDIKTDLMVIDNNEDNYDKTPTNFSEPLRDKQNPLDEDVIIVDETSMLGPTLYRQLMNALRRDSFIRFFGDDNQLLPVEGGAPPFRTLLATKPAVTLSYNFRSQDAIVSNALRILKGSIPMRNSQFEVIYSEQPMVELVRVASRMPGLKDSSHQIIMPTRRGNVGTAKINPYIQVKLNGKGPLLRLPRFYDDEPDLPVRAGDKFLWVKNDYALALFNGEIGTIEAIDIETGALKLRTSEDRIVLVPPRVKTYNNYLRTVINYDPRKQLELGYAITTHKGQGSEFDTVIYAMCSASAFLLNRNNFYTGVTRAKHRVIIITDRRGMSLALRREKRNAT